MSSIYWKIKHFIQSSEQIAPLSWSLSMAQKMKFSIRDFYNKCNQVNNFTRIWSHLPKKSLMENFIFSAVWEESYIWVILLLRIYNSIYNSIKFFLKVLPFFRLKKPKSKSMRNWVWIAFVFVEQLQFHHFHPSWS